jgi:hypothetical protein
MFLVEDLLLDTIGIAFHGEGSVLEMRQHDRSDFDVVVDELALGEG